MKMSIIEKIKAINKKNEQNKAQHDLDKKKTGKIPALSSRNVSKYEFLTGKSVKDVLLKKRLARKSCCIEKI